MKAPAFWDKLGLIPTLLSPFACLYAKAAAARWQHITPVNIDVPVICVGNITMGGAGKTPVALAIGERCKALGIGAFFLSRGYGGERIEPLLVNPALHDAQEVGDEPLLLARSLPTVVSKNRVDGARMAQAYGAQVIIMDDGFQNPSLAKDLSLLVIDGQYGLGNGQVFPAGCLREPAQAALARASAVIAINAQDALPFTVPDSLRVLHATTSPGEGLGAIQGKTVAAFCGIARPEKFFSMLAASGVTLGVTRAFADHHRYTAHDLSALIASGLPLVTTAKDAVRLPPEVRSLVQVVELSLAFEDMVALDALITDTMKHHESN